MAISDVILTANTMQYKLQMETAATTAEKTFWRIGIASGKAATMVQKHWVMVQATMKTFTNVLIAGAVALGGMTVAVGIATAAAMSFDDSLKRIAAVGGAEFADNMDDIRDKIFQLATTYGMAIDDITAGMIELVKSGFDYVQVMEMVDAVTMAARANQTTFAETSTLTVAALLLFRESGYSAAQMLEIMHTAANEAVLDLEDFNDILGFVGSTAYIFKLSLEEISAMMGALSQAAFKSHQSVRTLLLKLAAEAEDIEAILASAGIQIDVITDDMQLNLTEIIRAMEGVNLTTDQWVALMGELNIRSGAAFTTITALSGQYFRILEKLSPYTDNLKSASEDMAESLQALWARIVATVQQAIFTPEFIKEMAEVLGELRVAFEEVGPELRELVMQLVYGLKDNLPDLIALLMQLIRTTVTMMPAFRAFAKVAGVIAGIIAAIPPDILSVVIMMGMLTKIMQPMITAIWQANIALGTTVLLSSSLGFGLAGLAMIIASADPAMRALGFTLLALAGAFGAVAIARAAAFPLGSPLQIAAVVGIGAAIGLGIASVAAHTVQPVEGYQHGTEFVPQTGMYMLHRGEAVVPAEQNTFGPWQGGTQIVNLYDATKGDFDEMLAGYKV